MKRIYRYKVSPITETIDRSIRTKYMILDMPDDRYIAECKTGEDAELVMKALNKHNRKEMHV